MFLLLLLSVFALCAHSFTLEQLGTEKVIIANARRYPIKDISVTVCFSATACNAVADAKSRIMGSRILSLHGVGEWYSVRVTLPDEGTQTLFRHNQAAARGPGPLRGTQFNELRRRTALENLRKAQAARAGAAGHKIVAPIYGRRRAVPFRRARK